MSKPERQTDSLETYESPTHESTTEDSTTDKSEADKPVKLPLPSLIALVVGSMVGAGIFALPRSFAAATGGLGALIAWLIAGTGMYMLALVFQSLAQRRPDLDSGIFVYAKEGFGSYIGFAAALAFWTGSCVGNVSYWVLIKSTLGRFFPVFGDGNTLTAVLVASVLLWGFHYLILRGVQGAASVNKIVTIAKIVPLLVFVVFLIIHFNSSRFSTNFWGDAGSSIWQQVRRTMLVTVFVFIGVEAASVYSRYARKRSDVGLATILGFIGVLVLMMMVTVLSYGVMPRGDIAALRNPSVAGVMESMVGRWGTGFISAGLIISVLGAYLAWSLLAAEAPYVAAKYGLFPRYFLKVNHKNVPSAALWMTNIVIQAFLIVTLFTQYAFQLALELTSALTLIPYLLVAAYAFKLALSGETYERNPGLRTRAMIIGGLATVYTLVMIYSGGLKYVLLSAVILLPGTILFYLARREQNVRTFAHAEAIVFGIIAVGAAIAIFAIATGRIVV